MSQFRPRRAAPIKPSTSLKLRELAAAVTSLNIDNRKITERMLAAEARVAELEAENAQLRSALAAEQADIDRLLGNPQKMMGAGL